MTFGRPGAPRRRTAIARLAFVAAAAAVAVLVAGVARGGPRPAAPAPDAAPTAPAAPPPSVPQPAATAVRPLVPTSPRPASAGQVRVLEDAYLSYLRLLGDALLSLDPGPLGVGIAGPALDELTGEVAARRGEGRPARLAVAGVRLATYRDYRGGLTAVVSFVDCSAPVDPRTGALLPRPERPALVRETLTFGEVDGVTKVVGRVRQELGYRLPPPPAESGEALRSETGYRLRDGLDAVLHEAWLTLDPGRLDEVLSGEALRRERLAIERFRPSGYTVRNEYRPAIVDALITADGEGLVVEEVLADASVLLAAGDGRPAAGAGPRPLPVGRRRTVFERVDGAWRCVSLETWGLGTALE